jgi:hypothetical protein
MFSGIRRSKRRIHAPCGCSHGLVYGSRSAFMPWVGAAGAAGRAHRFMIRVLDSTERVRRTTRRGAGAG